VCMTFEYYSVVVNNVNLYVVQEEANKGRSFACSSI